MKAAKRTGEEIARALYGEKAVAGNWHHDSPVQQKLKYCLKMARASMRRGFRDIAAERPVR